MGTGAVLLPDVRIGPNAVVAAGSVVTRSVPPNWPPFTGSLGVLQFDGTGEAQFTLPAGMDASLAGIEFHHAYIVLDLFGAGAVVFASNAVPLTLVP